VIDDSYNEQEQWERVKFWLRDNGLWLLAGVLIGVGALAGWRWWEQRVEQRAQDASARYEEILGAFNRSDRTRAFTLIDSLRDEFPSSPYADQADLAGARDFIDQNELAKAAERLERVMKQSKDAELKLVSRLRLARVQLAQGNADAALATLDGADPGSFGPRFDEVRGDARLAKGDRPAALAAYVKARDADQDGVLDQATLELKIADLVADGVLAPAAATAVTPAAPAVQGK
jgi:predicted negative regulator of RcsB-dependent stress response